MIRMCLFPNYLFPFFPKHTFGILEVAVLACLFKGFASFEYTHYFFEFRVPYWNMPLRLYNFRLAWRLACSPTMLAHHLRQP